LTGSRDERVRDPGAENPGIPTGLPFPGQISRYIVVLAHHNNNNVICHFHVENSIKTHVDSGPKWNRKQIFPCTTCVTIADCMIHPRQGELIRDYPLFRVASGNPKSNSNIVNNETVEFKSIGEISQYVEFMS
jgi:hypothetical protein